MAESEENIIQYDDVYSDLIYDNVKLDLDGRQESTVRRFSTCDDWGILLLHKVGTGKTITSLLIALNTLRKFNKTKRSSVSDPHEIVVIAPVGIYNNFISDLIRFILFDRRSTTHTGTAYQPMSRNGSSDGPDAIYQFFDVYVKLINYTYDNLITDLNRKNRFNYENKIVIMDEAHRLLTNDIFNSTEAAYAMKKHPLIEDLTFREDIAKCVRLITMSGTPMQQSMADLCKFGNFLTKSEIFTTKVYAKRIPDLVWAQFFIKEIDVIGSTVGMVGSAILGMTAASASLPILAGTAAAVFVGSLAFNYAGVSVVQSYIDSKTIEHGIREHRGGSSNDFNITHNDIQQIPELSTELVAMLGTLFSKLIGEISKKIPSVDKLKTIGLTTGTSSLTSTLSDLFIFSQFTTENKEILDIIDNHVYNVNKLAEDLSKIISIYDYELQDILNLTCLTNINEKLNEKRLPNFNSYEFKNFVFTEKQSLDLLLEINNLKMLTSENIETIKQNPPKCNLLLGENDDQNDKNDTRYPSSIVQIENITFDEDQLDIIKRFCINLLTDTEKSLFYLDKYEKLAIDTKNKIDFFTNNMKFISSYSKDFINYYSSLDPAESDDEAIFIFKNNKYILNKRPNEQSELQVENPKAVRFECSKFKRVLEIILSTNSGKMPIMVDTTINSQNIFQEQVDIENGKQITNYYCYHAHGKYKNNNIEDITISDEKSDGYYLPVVYSYTEDYGLGTFANYLTSKGYNYILINKFQEKIGKTSSSNNSVYKHTYEGKNYDLLEYNKLLAFDKVYYGQDSQEPICVLIDPTMTEGLNAKYNPCIIVLEACNTYGDSEQVYGRVLRKYKEPYKYKKQKMIYQFITSAPDNYNKISQSVLQRQYQKFSTLYEIRKGQAALGNARAFTEKEYLSAASQFQYISPDDVHYKKIKREERNLKKFETAIKFNIGYADLYQTLECQKSTGGGTLFSTNEQEQIEYINLNATGNPDEDFFYELFSQDKPLYERIKQESETLTSEQKLEFIKLLKIEQDKIQTNYTNEYNKFFKQFQKYILELEPKINKRPYFNKIIELLYNKILHEKKENGTLISSEFIVLNNNYSYDPINIIKRIKKNRGIIGFLSSSTSSIASYFYPNNLFQFKSREFDTIMQPFLNQVKKTAALLHAEVIRNQRRTEQPILTKGGISKRIRKRINHTKKNKNKNKNFKFSKKRKYYKYTMKV